MSDSIKRKVCMLGAFGVGKTSLVRRFVQSMFSEKYLTTVGVKIDKKQVEAGGREVTLLIWDIAGEEDAGDVNLNYLRGAAGYFLVADGTRSETLAAAEGLRARVDAAAPGLPLVILLNKSDLSDAWEVDEGRLVSQAGGGVRVVRTSAKTGAGVEEAFGTLARLVAGPPGA